MTEWVKIEPVVIPISRSALDKLYSDPIAANPSKVKDKIKHSKARLEALVRECIEGRKLSFTDTVLELGVSPTTVRRVLRTIKIGRYNEQIPSELRSNSSQQPYGWKSVNGILEKQPSEWRCVELMFKLRSQGLSLHKIAAHLNAQKIPTKNHGQWHAKSVSQTLKFNEKFLINQSTDRRIT